eukprot:scaffold33435_cov32-Tisochrysis_lutea.AAC.4
MADAMKALVPLALTTSSANLARQRSGKRSRLPCTTSPVTMGTLPSSDIPSRASVISTVSVTASLPATAAASSPLSGCPSHAIIQSPGRSPASLAAEPRSAAMTRFV